VDHSIYDKRDYPVVDVREGYGEWVRTYEQTVLDEMDLRLLEALRTVDWPSPRQVLDLACGTGRIGAWLKRRSSAAIDGVDITPEMLAIAQRKDVYRALHVADVARTGLPAETYDLRI
jgi:predicted TPR repeat methyltransferase